MTMIKALLKKQLLEFFSGFNSKGKNGKGAGKGSKAGMIALFAFVGISFLFMFSSFAFMLSPLIEDGYGEVYFSVFGVLATAFGIFGSVFLTYNTLYEAKDNDLLLSMPIPPGMILFSRMAGLYITTLLFEALVYLPAFVIYLIFDGSVLSTVISFLNIFIMPFFALCISCILGWIIGVVASKVRNKGIITVIISFAFFGAYYFCMMRLNSFIELILINAGEIGELIKKWLYPVYQMGSGCAGDVLSYLKFFFITAAVFAVIYKILSATFIKLATVKREMKKAEYKEKKAKKSSAGFAFFKKELLFFKSTPAYMLNCALGSVMAVLFAVVFAVKCEEMTLMLTDILGVGSNSLPVVAGVALCFIASTNNMTSAAISLEGKTFWLIKSVPVDVKDVFFGKLMLHCTVTGIPLLVADIIVLVFARADILLSVMMIIFTEVFMTVCALTGLAINIIFPKIEWTNVTVPIKQSLSVFIGMFTGLFYCMFSISIWYATVNMISPVIFLTIIIVFYLLLGVLIYRWLITSGKRKFMKIG